VVLEGELLEVPKSRHGALGHLGVAASSEVLRKADWLPAGIDDRGW
jgi:hypothetical protein